ncbi:two-component system nitrate/nitrite response regulator NarL [Actimicrobium sp. GrIS 1.19]|uniref:response regulator transcription factor n=1 Tax=Actimicrobium sp. GrIS 1.19 TaxID=3071708 RepID=UPI002E03F5B2|nr:two-component system nitrate/nitrite response regulator NarL [Actimicrobium sp. GrIS 1.19]
MHLLLSGCADIIARFHAPLMEKGGVTCIASVAALWQQLPAEAKGLVVVDLALPGLNPSDTLAELRRRAPACRILVAGPAFSTDAELALLGLGVAGCCGSQLQADMVARIVATVLDGGVWISHAVMPLLLQRMQARATPAPAPAPAPAAERLVLLTPRERQIAQLVGGGASNKVIARELSITDRTVKAHLGAIFQKLDLPDRLQLALFVTAA